MHPLLLALLLLAAPAVPAEREAGAAAQCAPGAAVPFDCSAEAWVAPEEAPYHLVAGARTGGIVTWDVVVREEDNASGAAQPRG